MITEEEYIKAKAIVDEYEQAQYESGMRDAEDSLFDDDFMDDEDDIEERRENDRAEIALNCTCGAWGFSKTGAPVHISDCICGAD